jgi:hypothetical protein
MSECEWVEARSKKVRYVNHVIAETTRRMGVGHNNMSRTRIWRSEERDWHVNLARPVCESVEEGIARSDSVETV